MNKKIATLGYGYHLSETKFMLNTVLKGNDAATVRDVCIQNWPQSSEKNKDRMWRHLSKRYLDIEENTIRHTPFLQMYVKVQGTEAANDLIFFQLCRTTPLVLEVLRGLAREALLNTGEARFTRYHLNQILTEIFGHVTQSTSERVRQILRDAGRIHQEGRSYIARSSIPADAVLGFGLYLGAERVGWRAPSSESIVQEADIAAAFLTNRPLLVQGIQRLVKTGHCEYHRHGSTDQIVLIHPNVEAFVNAWTE